MSILGTDIAKGNSLRKLVRSILEAAIAGKMAANDGLALLIKPFKQLLVEYILYDPNVIYNLLIDEPNANLAEIDPTELIIGYIQVSPHHTDCWKAAEVSLAAAQKGYGPLMYEIVMSDFKTIMSDHETGTSTAAQNVWKKYSQRADVEKLPFDDIEDPQTVPTIDDCNLVDEDFLNMAYKGNGDSSGKQSMIKAHLEFLEVMRLRNNMPEQKTNFLLAGLAMEYFRIRYENG